MHIFHLKLIDLDLWNAFCEVSPWGSFLFTLQRQKVCTPGDEAIMKIHKKLFSGIPFNFTLFVISAKLQRIWSWNFVFVIRKIWAFIWYQKIYYFRLSPGDENLIAIRCFKHTSKLSLMRDFLFLKLAFGYIMYWNQNSTFHQVSSEKNRRLTSRITLQQWHMIKLCWRRNQECLLSDHHFFFCECGRTTYPRPSKKPRSTIGGVVRNRNWKWGSVW